MSTILKPVMTALLGLCLAFSAFSQTQGPTLIYPKHQAVLLRGDVTFEWNIVPGAASYQIQVSSSPAFSTILYNNASVPTPFLTVPVNLLNINTDLYWRVSANGLDWSPVHSFFLLNPRTFANLQLWVRGDSGVVTNTSLVGQWTDYSNNNVQLIQTDAAAKPTHSNAPRLENAPVLSFDGTNDYLAGAQALELRTNDQTILIVFNSTVTGTGVQTRLIQKRGHTSNTDGWALAPRSNEWNSSVIEESGNTATFQQFYAEPPLYAVNDGNYRIVSTVWKNSIGEWHLYTNSRHYIKATENGTLDGVDIQQNANKIMTVGCSWNSPTDIRFFHKGNIAEIMVYHTALDSVARPRVEQYLRHKYTPPINLGRDIVRYSLCDTTLNVGKSYYSYYQWYNLDRPDSMISSASSLHITQSGTYRLAVRDTFGYTSSDTLRIDFPEPAQLPRDTAICYGDTVKITSLLGPNYDYLWSNGDTTESLNITEEGLYYVRITYPGRCSVTTDSFYVAVNLFNRDATLGPDDTFCPGNTLGLIAGADGAVDYLWSDGTTNPTITLFTSDTFWVQVIDTLGCEITDTIIATVVPGVLPDVDFTFDSVCVGSATPFLNNSSITSGSSIESFDWDFDDNTSDTATHPLHVFDTSGYFNVKLTATSDIGCNNSTTKTVVVFATPTVDYTTNMVDYNQANIDYAGCVGTLYSFMDSSFSATAPDFVNTWDWDFGDNTNSIQQNPTHSYNTQNVFDIILRVETQFGCVAYDTQRAQLFSGILDPEAFSLHTPPANTITDKTAVVFRWNESVNTHYYRFQLATDSFFTANSIVFQTTTDTTFYTLQNISQGNYYWRVIAVNLCGIQVISDIPYGLTIFGNGLVNGMQLWLKADADVINSGDSVSAWYDQSGNANHFFQPTLDRQPRLLPTALNGHPTVYFQQLAAAVSKFMDGGNRLDLGRKDQSIFVVFNSENNVNDQYRIIQKRGKPSSGLSYAPGWCVAARGNRLSPSVVENANGRVAFSQTDYAMNNGCFRILNTIWDNSEGNWDLYLNGDFKENSRNLDIANDSFTTSKNVSLACAWDNPSTSGGQDQFFYGNIAEIIMYDRALDATQRKFVENYLRQKYYPSVNLGQDIELDYGFCTEVLLDAGECAGCSCRYRWSTGDTTRQIVAPGQGVYAVTVTDGFGFTSSDSVIIKGGFNTVSFSDTVYLCLGDTLLWDTKLDTPGYSFQWQDGSTNGFYKIYEGGQYWVHVQDTLDCGDDFESDILTVVIDSFSVTASLGPDTNLCGGNRISLVQGAEDAIQFLWSPGGSTDRELTIFTTGDYSITAANINHCIMDDTLHVDIRGLAPDAKFSFNRTCLKDSTFFADRTTGRQIETWEWDFGDGSTANVQHPTHLFADTGFYNVSLTVMDDTACYQKFTKTVEVLQLPTPMFTNELINCANDPVLFYDSSRAPAAQTIVGYLWDFDDSNFSSAQDASNTFATNRKYDVALTVTTDSGCANTIVRTIEIAPELVAAIDVGNLCFDNPVDFYDASPGLSTRSWFWDFDDNNTFSTERNPLHIFSSPGIYNVSLEIENAIGCKRTAVKTITVTGKPVVDFDNPPACEGTFYRFRDNSFITGGDMVVSREWDFGDQSPMSAMRNPTHYYDTAGNYTVTLEVVTQNGCASFATKTVSILEPPVAAFTYTPEYGPAPLTVTFTNESQDASGYIWDFGDGSPISNDENPVHVYDDEGLFDITLIVFNEGGCTDTVSASVNVSIITLDLILGNIHVTKEVLSADNDCHFALEMYADIIDNSTQPVKDFDITAHLWGQTAFMEHWSGNFTSRNLTYDFNGRYIVHGCENMVLCMEVTNPNGLPDNNPADNYDCIPLGGDFVILNPYANPAGDLVRIKLITPSKGTLNVFNYNVIGQELGELKQMQLDRGMHELEFDVSNLAHGVYLMKIQFNEDTRVFKYVKQ